MDDGQISEEVVTLVHAIRDHAHLREWLFRLEQCPDSVRRIAFDQMLTEMRAAGEDSALITAIAELANPQICTAACHALRALEPE